MNDKISQAPTSARKSLLVGGAVLLLGVALALGYGYSRRQKNEISPLYGNVDIRDVNLAFRVAGRVSEVLVDEGARIQPGQVLAKLDLAPLENTLHAAEAQWASAQSRNHLMHRGYRDEDVQQAEARKASAQAALTEAQAYLQRQQALVASGASAQRTLDNAQSVRDQAAAALAVAQAQTTLYRTGYRKEEVAESDAALAQSKANLDIARLALSDAVLTAPSEAIVLSRMIEKGAMVQAGTPVFNLSLVNPVWVRAYVSEPQLGHYATATAVLLYTDTRPGKPYQGVVGFVSPNSEFTPKSVETPDLRTSMVYRIRVVVQDPDAGLRQGMPVTITRK